MIQYTKKFLTILLFVMMFIWLKLVFESNLDLNIMKLKDNLLKLYLGKTLKNQSETSSIYDGPKRYSSITAQEETKIKNFYNELADSEKKIYSQNNEDGVILKLLEFLNIEKNGFYVEFGTEQGLECNTRNLRENYGWKGLLMDGSNQNLDINLHKETISHENILQLLQKHNIQDKIDILSEDTDYADYWIVEQILTKYNPKIVIHEVNQQPPELCVTVPKSKELIFWDGSNFHGGSVCAFWCLAKRFNYTMVYCETKGVNCFWVRNDLLYILLMIDIDKIQDTLNPKLLFKKASFVYPATDNQWFQVSC